MFPAIFATVRAVGFVAGNVYAKQLKKNNKSKGLGELEGAATSVGGDSGSTVGNGISATLS